MLALPGAQTSQNIFHHIRNREYGPKTKRELINDAAVSFVNRCTARNITENNCTKTIYNGQSQSILAFDVKGHFAAIHYWNKALQLWNLETRKCLWTFNVKLPVYGSSLVKIIGGKVVCAGLEKFNDQTTIRIVDLESGEETTSFTAWSEDDDTVCSQICILGKSIYTFKQNGIIERDLNGRDIRSISHENLLPATLFIGQGKFLVHISKADITIHDLENDEKDPPLKIGIDTLEEGAGSITSAFLDSGRLICSMIGEKNTKPSCCVIDLQSGVIIQRYSHKDYAGELFFLPEHSKIKKILAKQDWIYLANDLGGLAAINLEQKSHHFLGWHKNSIQNLALDGDVLISASGSNLFHSAELKFWDTKTLKLLASKEFDNLKGLLFNSGKVFAGVEKSFVQWDYLVTHKGEELSECSAPQIENDTGARNCIIQ